MILFWSEEEVNSLTRCGLFHQRACSCDMKEKAHNGNGGVFAGRALRSSLTSSFALEQNSRNDKFTRFYYTEERRNAKEKAEQVVATEFQGFYNDLYPVLLVTSFLGAQILHSMTRYWTSNTEK